MEKEDLRRVSQDVIRTFEFINKFITLFSQIELPHLSKIVLLDEALI